MEEFVICMLVFVAGILIGAGYKEDQIEESEGRKNEW